MEDFQQEEAVAQAERLIWSDPDSTARLLTNIERSQLSINTQKRYDLLHIHSSLQQGICIFSDTTIDGIITYFHDRKDYPHLCKALYVKAIEQESNARSIDCMTTLKEAEQYIIYLDTADYSCAGMVLYFQALVYETERLFHLSILKYKDALPYFIRIHDHRRCAYCLLNIAGKLAETGDSTKDAYYAQALHYAAQTQDILLYKEILLRQGIAATPRDEQAIKAIAKYLCDTLRQPRFAHILAEQYIRQRQLDSAQHYLSFFAVDTPHIEWCKERYYYLYSTLLAAQGNKAAAYNALQQVYEQKEQHIKNTANIRTYLVARQYDVEQEQQKNLRLTIIRQRLWATIGLSVSACIIALLVVLFYLYRERMERRRKEEEDAAHIRQLGTEIAAQRNALQEVLRSRINLTKRISLTPHTDSEPLPRSTQALLDEIAYHRETDWQTLRQEFNHLYANLLERLHTQHPALTAQDEQVIVFGVLGFDTNDTALLLGLTNRTLWNRRQKLKARLGIDDIEAWFAEQSHAANTTN